LQRQFFIPTGTIWAQDEVANFERQVLEFVISKDFIGAQVETTVQTVEAPQGATEKAYRWVRLVLKLQTGVKATFGFRGNHFFTKEDFALLIKEQRESGFGADYVETIRKLIQDLYIKNAFPHVQVKAYPFESKDVRHITFEIQEGPRVKISDIEFDGNRVFSSEELEKEWINRASTLVQSGYYSLNDIERAAELMIQWIRSKGYLSAKLVSINPSFDQKKNTVSLKVFLYEGEQTLIQNIKIQGNVALSASEIESILGIREGIPLDLYRFSEGIEQIKVKYRNLGYLSFEVVNEYSDEVVVYSNNNRFAEIHLVFNEGPQYRVSQIRLDAPIHTREYVVMRELLLKPGDVCEEYKINLSEANIRRLGIFSQVQIRVLDDPESSDKKILSLFITEGTPGVASTGVGLRNDLGVRTFGQIAYTNLLHRNHTLSFTVNANRRIPQLWERRLPIEYQAQLDYVWPWFLGDRLRVRPALRFDRTQYLNFDVIGRTASLTFDRPILSKPNLSASFTYQLENIRQFNAVASVDNQRLLIGSIAPSIRLDLRDDPLAPTRGFYFWTVYEIASKQFGAQTEPYEIGYTRWQMRADYTFPLPLGASFYSSFRTGIQRSTVAPRNQSDPNDPSGSIPLIKQFFLGGPNSLRGFRYQELNVQDRLIRGVASYVNYRTQLDLPFSGGLKWGPFLDAGNLLVDDYSFGQLRYGTGIGFRYHTPVGPINFDWGFKIKPRLGESPYQFNFSIGLL
jgi:outer membrane protein insertion porin family